MSDRGRTMRWAAELGVSLLWSITLTYAAASAKIHHPSWQEATRGSNPAVRRTCVVDSLANMVYPSTRAVTTCYDTHGRPKWVSRNGAGATAADCAGGAPPVASAGAYWGSLVEYAPHGAMKQLRLGNGLYETAEFNNRQQARMLRLGNAPSSGSVWEQESEYGATAGSNNGNVTATTLRAPGQGDIVTRFQYDGVNRLRVAMENPLSVSSGCVAGNVAWCQVFDYDAMGNRRVTAAIGVGGAGVPSVYVAGSNQVGDAGWGYDGRGNVKQIPFVPATPDRLRYDGEDRLTDYCGMNPAAVCDGTTAGAVHYVYDGAGRRVKRVGSPGGDVVMVYDAFGNLAAEYGGAPGAGGVSYVTADVLGSTRVITGADGLARERHDYHPFGTEVARSGSGVAVGYGVDLAARHKFTGKERDAETGLDYFGLRQMSAAQGRFTSPDPNGAGASLFDPQSWNAYSYVNNRPLTHVDPDGDIPIPVITGAVGAGVGALVGGGAEAFSQWSKTGTISWGKVGTAALGGGIAGGIAGATLVSVRRRVWQ